MPGTLQDLGRAVKKNFPGQFDDLDDAALGRSFQKNNPGQFDDFADMSVQLPASRAEEGRAILTPKGRQALGQETPQEFQARTLKQAETSLPASGFRPQLPKLPKQEATGPVARAADVTLGAVGRGVLNFGAGLAGGAAWMGIPGADSVARVTESFAEPSSYVEELTSSPDKWYKPEFWVNLGLEGVGSSLGSVVPGVGVGASVARLTQGMRTAAQLVAGSTAAGALEAFANSGDLFMEMRDKYGASPEVASTVAAANMLREVPLNVATEALGLFNPAQRALVRGALGASFQGIQEIGQGEIQHSVKKAAGAPAPERTMDERIQEFVGAALGGGIMGASMPAIERGVEAMMPGPAVQQLGLSEPVGRETAPTARTSTRPAEGRADAFTPEEQAAESARLAELIPRQKQILEAGQFPTAAGPKALTPRQREVLTQAVTENERTLAALPVQAQPNQPIAQDIASETEGSVGGGRTMVRTTAGRRVPVQYEVREADALRNSFDEGYPAELQPRDTSRIGTRQRVAQRKADLDPELMAESRLASDGAPIIRGDGAVVTRNHGSQALRELYRENRAQGYRQWLEDNADVFGVDPEQVRGMRAPVLVRRALNDADMTREFALEANASSTARMSEAEVAQVLAEKATGRVMDTFDPSEDGTPNAEFVRELVKDLPVEEQAAFMGRGGRLSQAGTRLVRNVIFAKAYPDTMAIERMAEDEEGARVPVNGMLRAAPAVARLEEQVKRGERFDLGIGAQLVDAVTVVDGLTRKKQSADEWLRQQRMDDMDPVIPQLVRILKENARSAKKVGEFIREYTEVVDSLGSPQQESMFGPMEPPSRAEIATIAYERAKERWDTEKAEVSARKAGDAGQVAGDNAQEGRGQGQRLAGKRTPGFFSQLQRTIEAKMPAKANALQVRAILANPQSGVKADEIKWTGLDEFLASKPTVTKAEVQEFLKANEVRVEEVERGQQKYASYALPGGENYRELLLTLPVGAFPAERARDEDLRALEDVERALVLAEEAGDKQEAARLSAEAANRSRAMREKYGERYATGEPLTPPYKSSHWDTPNVLAHIRFDERKDAQGRKVLHIAEIQSDWHQEGRKKGYSRQSSVIRQEIEGKLARQSALGKELEDLKASPKAKVEPLIKQKQALYEEYRQSRGDAALPMVLWVARPNPELARIDSEIQAIWSEFRSGVASSRAKQIEAEISAINAEVQDLRDEQSNPIPAAPFAKTWHELAFRRAVRWAVENGFDVVTWDTGETSADRYDLAKQVDKIAVPTVNENSRAVRVDVKSGTPFKMMVDRNGVVDGVSSASQFSGKTLDEVIGKELAQKVMELTAPAEFAGNDLKVGGEGMKGFYDEILPAYAKKWGKKFGATVAKQRVGALSREEARKQVLEHQFFEINDEARGILADEDTEGRSEAWLDRQYDEIRNRLVEAAVDAAIAEDTMPVHSMEITPAMREGVMQGMPLFGKLRQQVDRWLQFRLPMAASKVDAKRPTGELADVQKPKAQRLAAVDAVLVERSGERPAIVSANSAALRTVMEAFGDPETHAGLALNAVSTAELRGALQTMAERAPINQKRAIQKLLKAVTTANEQNDGRGVILVDATPGIPAAEIRKLLKEELAHWKQFELGKGQFRGHVDTAALSVSPQWRAVKQGLAARGYDTTDADAVAVEGAAQILAGVDLGLTSEQEAEFLKEYGRLLDKQHGEGTAASVFRYAQESVGELFNEEESGQANQQDAGATVRANPESETGRRGPPAGGMEGRAASDRGEKASTVGVRKPVQFDRSIPRRVRFVRRPSGAAENFNFGSTFGQDIEPAGRYMVEQFAEVVPDGFVSGEVVFQNPLYLPLAQYQWKQRLSDKYGGKTGKALSRAIVADGFDGIITYDEYGTSEIVDLTSFAKPGRQGGLFDATTETEVAQAAQRDREQLQKREAEATLASPLVPKKPQKAPKRGPQGDLFAGSDPQESLFGSRYALTRPAMKGAELIAEGMPYTTWQARMLDEFGEGIRPRLLALYSLSRSRLTSPSRLAGKRDIDPGKVADESRRGLERDGLQLEIKPDQPWLDLIRPVGNRLRRMGAGELADSVQVVRNNSRRMAGEWIYRLSKSGMRSLSTEQRDKVLDYLEGRLDPKKLTDDERTVAETMRGVTDEVAGFAEALGVKVRMSNGEKREFIARENYFPHFIRPTRFLKSGIVRTDVLRNMVRTNRAASEAEASQLLDSFIEYVDNGGRQQKLIDHLISTGQAKNEADAEKKLARWKDHSYGPNRDGSLEYSRELDLPFYDPDPVRVLEQHAESAAGRLATIAEFGQEQEKVFEVVAQIREAGGDADKVRKLIQGVLNGNRATEKEQRVPRFLMSLQLMRLGLAGIENVGQALNVLAFVGMPTFAAALPQIRAGKDFALQTGALRDANIHQLESVFSADLRNNLRRLTEEIRERRLPLGDIGRAAVEAATVGLRVTDELNRTLAASAGAALAQRALREYERGDKKAGERLRELKIDPEKAKRGGLSKEDLANAALVVADATQFTSRPEEMPEFASANWGRVLWQFKNFSYQQTRFVYRQMANGDWDDRLLGFFVFAMLYPAFGELSIALRSFLTGYQPKRPDVPAVRYLDDMARMGTLGMWADLASRSTRYGGPIFYLTGPTGATVDSGLRTVATVSTTTDLEKQRKAVLRFAVQHLPYGSMLRRFIEEPKK